MATKTRKTDEQRLKEIQARIDKKKKAAELKQTIEKSRAELKKLRG